MDGVKLCFPHLNTTFVKSDIPYSEALISYIVLSFISLLIALLNLLVIISISHFRTLHTPNNLLLLSLAFSDFFVSLVILFRILFLDGCWTFGDNVCTFCFIAVFLITSASVGNIVLIAVDRYVAICDPLHYPTKVTQQRVRICIFFCWSFSLFWSIVMMIDVMKNPGKYKSCYGECIMRLNPVEETTDLILTFIIPIAVIVVLYTRVFVVAVSQARAARSNIASVTQHQSNSVKAKKSELKAATSLGVVVLVFLICVLPYYCYTITGQGTDITMTSATFVTCLFYFNSFLNPLIYAFFYPWFRKAIKLIITLQILQPDSCYINMQ